MRPAPHVRDLFLYPLLASAPLFGQGPTGDPTLEPKGLRVVVVDVGQGDSTIVTGPTGTTLVVDAGFENEGRLKVIPALRKLGVTQIHFAVASHYDPDHIGGLDEVIDNFPVLSVWDRGLFKAPTHTSYKNYVRSAGAKRNTVQIGTAFILGGGAKATVIAANGKVLGGASYPISGTNQFENASSVVLKVQYDDFSMWLGGDLTGGGNSTYDMESKVAKVCGDVDVYHVDHHGSNTSSNATMLGHLKPEVCLASAGFKNPFGHPTITVTNRINSKANSRLFLCTTTGANSIVGFGRGGSITLVTDGYRYRVQGDTGPGFDIYTDEVAATRVPAGTVQVSEIHRQPKKSDGEYLELYCQGPHPVNLRGLVVSGNLGSFTVGMPYRLLPGDTMLLYMHGDAAKNGGIPLAHCLPYRAITFGNIYDTIRLTLNGVVQDTLSFSGSFAGGSGIAAERVDHNLATATFNFRAATKTYGSGDRGTPWTRNSVDTTKYRPLAAMEVLPSTAPGGRAVHLIATAFDHRLWKHAMAMSLGSAPGMTLAGTHIPLNPDVLFDASLLLPGVMGTVPNTGRRGLRIRVPTVSGLQGLNAVFAHVILDANGPLPFPAASNAAPFIFP